MITNSIGMKLVRIPAGEFMMGDTLSPEEVQRKWPGGQIEGYRRSHPRHRVFLTSGFYMGATEVTRGQFALFVRETKYKTYAEKKGSSYALKDNKWGEVSGVYWRNSLFEQTDVHPVVCVNHNDAVAFCDWLSKKENKIYTLPTEAQWEYACRAGSDTTTWYWGDEESGAQGCANVAGEGESLNWNYKFKGVRDGYTHTAPVASFEANKFGLYDMIGNVWEWCGDWYGSYSSDSVVDPPGPSSGDARVLRGGSWYHNPRNCRSADRYWGAPDSSFSNIGFRVVCDDF
ncbi:MAG: formylglycine-generating enzyme family protein [Sedimentisphaerales bacterium]|nr:formylglycine-generating enzyme family protein [Sedimentisphaerales bacterium]